MQWLRFLVLLWGMIVLGCDSAPPEFSSNLLFQVRMERETQVDLESIRQEVDAALVDLFGTPDQPLWPEFLKDHSQLEELVSRDHLARAAGPVGRKQDKVERGLYRKHCAHCHGITGDGLGPTASFENPYPRDFRRGTFKFKSTEPGAKPTYEDIARTLSQGIPGTAMPAYQTLENSEHFKQDIETLVHYVRYLAIRGEVERQLIAESSISLDIDRGEHLYDVTIQDANSSEFKKQLDRVHRIVRQVAQGWADASSKIIQVEDNHLALEFPESLAKESSQRTEAMESIRRGRVLFQSQTLGCSICHGPLGLGNGKTQDFDEWTKDWTIRSGIDPNLRSQWRPFKKWGALAPRKNSPRNLHLGVYRGGSQPSDLYRRMVGGIEGATMPPVAMKPHNPQGLEPAQVWDLVNFVRSLPYLTEVDIEWGNGS